VILRRLAKNQKIHCVRSAKSPSHIRRLFYASEKESTHRILARAWLCALLASRGLKFVCVCVWPRIECERSEHRTLCALQLFSGGGQKWWEWREQNVKKYADPMHIVETNYRFAQPLSLSYCRVKGIGLVFFCFKSVQLMVMIHITTCHILCQIAAKIKRVCFK